MKPLLVSSGEPAGIGPDICLALAHTTLPVVVAGDPLVLANRAKQLNQSITLHEYQPGQEIVIQPSHLTVFPIACPGNVVPGQLNPKHAMYVLELLKTAAIQCLAGEFSALVTAPVHKAVINDAGIPFSGHTEFLAELTNTPQVVMMLACAAMKVALVTTHLPLQAVSVAITQDKIKRVIQVIHTSFQQQFKKPRPAIAVTGLNPHAGENGYLGREEIEVISPALQALQNQGIHVQGPFPADTLFTPHYLHQYDVFVAMYHDKGLPVLKYAGFGQAVNVTLGLPFIRTSVDHGTALHLAGTGQAESSSLLAAIDLAQQMVLS